MVFNSRTACYYFTQRALQTEKPQMTSSTQYPSQRASSLKSEAGEIKATSRVDATALDVTATIAEKQTTANETNALKSDDLKQHQQRQQQTAKMSEMASRCSCKADEHADQMGDEDEEREQDELAEEAADREWLNHTQTYLDAFDRKSEELEEQGVKSRDTERELGAWQRTHHAELCCMLRHQNSRFIYTT